MHKLRNIALCLAVFACAIMPCTVSAEVFSLWPFYGEGGQGGASSSTSAGESLNPTHLWSEPVQINGRDMSLGISLLNQPLDHCLLQLRRTFPKASFARNSNSSLFELSLDSGMRRRLYLVQLDGIFPVVMFSMDIPDKMPKGIDWPADMPLPPSSTPEVLMRFPKRGSAFLMFSSPLRSDEALAEMTKSLMANGWRPAEGNASRIEQGGDVFLRENPMEMMVIGVSKTNDGSASRGTIYTRRTK